MAGWSLRGLGAGSQVEAWARSEVERVARLTRAAMEDEGPRWDREATALVPQRTGTMRRALEWRVVERDGKIRLQLYFDKSIAPYAYKVRYADTASRHRWKRNRAYRPDYEAVPQGAAKRQVWTAGIEDHTHIEAGRRALIAIRARIGGRLSDG